MLAGAGEGQGGAAPSATFYVDAGSGDDRNDGRSPAQAWRTLARLNAQPLPAGSSVLLRGGQVFTGTLVIDEHDGAQAGPVVSVGSFGPGRATIRSGPERGISVLDRAVALRDLLVVGDGQFASGSDGVVVHNGLDGDVLLDGVTISRVEVSGYGGWGIALGGGTGRSGYRNALVEDVDLHGNGRGGLLTYAAEPNVHENVRVLRSRAHDNPGLPGVAGHSGNGIVLGSVSGGEIAHSVAYRNGGANQDDDEGPAGIWAYHSDRVVIQFNESYANRTGSRADGDGFDLDVGTTNSVLQYNHSYGNDGAGFLLWQEGPVASGSNIVRYNVSQGDGRRNGYGGITLGGASPGTVIVHNTVVAGGGPAVALFDGPSGHALQDNVLVGPAGGPIVSALPDDLTPAVTFAGNAYHAGGGPFDVRWAGMRFTDLGSWRDGTGQERLAGSDVGRFVDPEMEGRPTTGPTGGLIGPPRAADVRLRPTSPLVDGGLPLSVAVRGGRDFSGSPVPQGRGADVGAHEVR